MWHEVSICEWYQFIILMTGFHYMERPELSAYFTAPIAWIWSECSQFVLIEEVKKILFLLTQLYSIQDIWMIFLTLLVVEIFSFQTYFISLIFHGTSLYGVIFLFDVTDAALKHPSKDVLTFQKQSWLRHRCVWSLLVFVLVAAIITTLVVALSESESNSEPPSKAHLCYLWKMHRLQLLQ